MLICEHKKSIVNLIEEFGSSCKPKIIEKWYLLKKDYLEKNEELLPNTLHVVTYLELQKDLNFSFPDNITGKYHKELIKSYKNKINS